MNNNNFIIDKVIEIKQLLQECECGFRQISPPAIDWYEVCPSCGKSLIGIIFQPQEVLLPVG